MSPHAGLGPEVPGSTASEEEFERMRLELIRAVRRTCPPYLANDAEDLVQEALIKVMSIQRRSETSKEFSSSYLWRVGYSAVIDEIRRRQRRPEAPLEESHEQQAGREPGPDKQYAGRQLGQALRTCLEEMIAPRRAAVLSRIHGHQVSEVAQLMKWKVKRAKNLTYRGLEDLKDCLQSRGFESES